MVEGDLKVNVPFLGRKIEPEIAKIVSASLRSDVEQGIKQAQLSSRQHLVDLLRREPGEVAAAVDVDVDGVHLVERDGLVVAVVGLDRRRRPPPRPPLGRGGESGELVLLVIAGGANAGRVTDAPSRNERRASALALR